MGGLRGGVVGGTSPAPTKSPRSKSMFAFCAARGTSRCGRLGCRCLWAWGGRGHAPCAQATRRAAYWLPRCTREQRCPGRSAGEYLASVRGPVRSAVSTCHAAAKIPLANCSRGQAALYETGAWPHRIEGVRGRAGAVEYGPVGRDGVGRAPRP